MKFPFSKNNSVPFTSLLTVLFSLSYVFCAGQFSVTKKWAFPEPISNAAVCSAVVDGTPYLFVFGGIDSTKESGGIHLRSYKTNLLSGMSTRLPDLPDSLGKIGVAASVIGDTIYICGGYHVLNNGSEITSNKMHRFCLTNDDFCADGPNIPYATDDHVQAVWQKKFLYLVTGWSNSTNIRRAQYYNPQTGVWKQASTTPNTIAYKAFGSSGIFVGDTLFYFSGATSSSGFASQYYLRRGIVNPNNPSDIAWSFSVATQPEFGYRMACFKINGKPFWAGGSEVTYNYDGISYNGTGGVEPSYKIISWNNDSLSWKNHGLFTDLPMDLRGLGSTNSNTYYVVGGMDKNQQVLDSIVEIHWEGPNSILPKSPPPTISIGPNPSNGIIWIHGIKSGDYVVIFNQFGQIITRKKMEHKGKFDLSEQPSGIYFIHFPEHHITQKLLIE